MHGLARRICQSQRDHAFGDFGAERPEAGGAGLSCSRPSAPARRNRSCHPQTAVLATPAARMISAVPWPSAGARCEVGELRRDVAAADQDDAVG